MLSLRRLRDERGLTVIELVIVSALLMIVVGAALSMLDSGTRTERLQEARHTALLDLRGAMTRMTKDIRQAVWVDPESTRSRFAMTTLVAGEEQDIAYAVQGDQLVRILGGATESTEVLLADHVTSLQPFCYEFEEVEDADGNSFVECNEDAAPDTDWNKVLRIEVALEPEVFSGGPITLATEIRLRNQ